MKRPNKVGGGAQTNVYGLHFEQTTDLAVVLNAIKGYKVIGYDVFKDGKKVALLCGKHQLYKLLLEPKGIDVKSIVSKRMLPDEAILVGSTVYLIEKKFQSGAGSVDEKLQTCDYKKKQYSRLLACVGIKVEYIYVLNDWFKKPEYKDVHDYILSVGCKYYFNEIPLSAIGL